jgi:hypothetical protein
MFRQLFYTALIQSQKAVTNFIDEILYLKLKYYIEMPYYFKI